MTQPVLYLVTCGAPLAARAADGVQAARDRGWWPAVIPTEASLAWIDPDNLTDTHLVTGLRDPDGAKRLPPADGIAVVPATFNTLNAWANGTANTYPLATLCAALGARVPTIAVPFAKHDLAGHPAWLASLAVLRYAGVTIIDPSTGNAGHAEPLASGTGEQISTDFQWSWVLDPLEDIPPKTIANP